MMGYVIEVTEPEYNVRICISHAQCAGNAYQWARANGYDVTISSYRGDMPIRSEAESSLAQNILSEWVDKGLMMR
jgi:hypothetical protein